MYGKTEVNILYSLLLPDQNLELYINSGTLVVPVAKGHKVVTKGHKVVSQRA